MRRWQVVAVGAFAAFALLPTVSAFAIDRYVRWSIQRFFEHTASVTNVLTLPGGRLRIEGTPVLFTGFDAQRTFLWHARYGDEFVGSWQASKNGTRAYTVDSLVVVIPGEDYYMDGVSRVFVRTRRGTWHESQLNFRDIADGVDPPALTAALTSIGVEDLRTIRSTLGPRDRTPMTSSRIEGFSAERAELLVYYQAAPKSAGRVHLALTPDGDAWRLTGIDDLRASGGTP
jgi:hypothetical protein